MKFVGIDLAWSDSNQSGVAVIGADGTVSRAASNLHSNEEISEYAGLTEREEAIIAIDAPLVVKNEEGQRPVERQLTEMFGPFDAGPHSASLKNPMFHQAGRISQFVSLLQELGFEQGPAVRKQQPQRVFLEVFPNPAQVIMFPAITRSGHYHYRAPRYKFKAGRSWTETQCEWEIYRARLLSLRACVPPIKYADEVKKSLSVDIEGYKGRRYKALDDLLDGILCAYLAYYFWYWGECWTVGDSNLGYVVLPYCRLPNCSLLSSVANVEV